MDLFVGIIGIVLLGAITWKIFFVKEETKNDEEERRMLLEENIRLKKDFEQKTTENGKLIAELENEKKDRNLLSGENKKMWAENHDLKKDLQILRSEKDELKKNITKHDEEFSRKEKEHEEKIARLEHAREKFQLEQERVIREDEEKRKKQIEERDKMWNDHENTVIARLREICQIPEIAFRSYDNTNLPEQFDGSFKPDFLIDFLGQYLYFDAKVSRSENLENYLKNQFKNTVLKLKKNPQIYKHIFFVVPNEAILGVRTRVEHIEGYTFFVISPEAIESLLFAYKRITEYENLKEFDPEEREKIVEVLARFEHFIRHQNTANILFAQKAFDTLGEKSMLSEGFLNEMEIAVKNLKMIKFKDSDFKKMAENVEEQRRNVAKLTSPEVKISEKDLEEAGQMF